MESKIAKVSFNKSGGTARGNAITNRITIPTSWIKEMGIDINNRNVEIIFDGEQILVKKLNGEK